MSRLLQSVMGIVILLGVAPGIAGELVKNGDFRAGTAAWVFNKQKSFTGTAAHAVRQVNGAPAYTVSVSGDANNGAVNLSQPVSLVTGKHYQLSVDMKGKGDGKVPIKINRNKKPWSHIGVQRPLKPGLDWRRYVLTFQAKDVPSDHQPTLRLQFGGFQGHLALRNISLREIPARKINGPTGDLKELAIIAAPVTAAVNPPPSSAKPTPQPGSRLQPKTAEPSYNYESKEKLEQKPPRPSTAMDPAALVDQFLHDSMQARKQLTGKRVALSGRLTRVADGSLGGATLELEGGRVKVQIPRGILSTDQARFARSELAVAKRRMSQFANYAREQGMSTRERRARELDACPRVKITADFAGFRSNTVNFRNGAKLSLTKGQELPSKN